MRERIGLVITLAICAVGGLALIAMLQREYRLEPAPSDPRVAAAILALAEDNVKLREAYASCGRSRAGLEEALKKERAK